MIRRILTALVLVSLILVSCRTAPEVPEGNMFSLLPEDFPVIRAGRGGFSPNGDGLFDEMLLYPEVGRQEDLTSWQVDIEDTNGNSIRRFTGKAPVADVLVWDGLEDSSRPAGQGLYKARFRASFGPEDVFEAETAPFSLVLEGPDVLLEIEDGAFSPDSDGVDDTYVVGISTTAPETIASWEIMVRDPEGTPFFLRKNLGAPPAEWVWDGIGAKGNTALSGADYPIKLTVEDIWGNKTVMDWQVHIDVLVIDDGERYIISLSRIIFQPYTADYLNVSETDRLSNEKTLDQVAAILGKYKEYNVQLVGHAVHVYWNRPNLMVKEQNEILIPLSLARAKAIRDALVSRGINASRMSVEGRGGAEPIVPHSDLRNRWKNRRVVFFLTP